MRGLEFEFERFRSALLQDTAPEHIENVKLTFMCGGLAATQRFLDILNSGLPDKRIAALIRRVAREAESFKNEMMKPATEGETNGR